MKWSRAILTFRGLFLFGYAISDGAIAVGLLCSPV